MTLRMVDRIHAAPDRHWVGDGFYVHSMFTYTHLDKLIDPFLMLDYAAPYPFTAKAGRPRGVNRHPHKGFETVTIAYQGEVAHRDSSGGGGVLEPGDVQWMTAGCGIVHEEFHSDQFTARGGVFEMVQLWVNLPAHAKLDPPRYQHLSHHAIPTVTLYNAERAQVGVARIIAGTFIDRQYSCSGIAQTVTPINLWDVHIEAHGRIEISLPQSHHVMFLVRHGTMTLNQNATDQIEQRQLVTFSPAQSGQNMDQIIIHSGASGVDLVVMSGTPLNEPIAGYGPFVMNTQQEIENAIAEFRSGQFGVIH